jgi:hypothetical protein
MVTQTAQYLEIIKPIAAWQAYGLPIPDRLVVYALYPDGKYRYVVGDGLRLYTQLEEYGISKAEFDAATADITLLKGDNTTAGSVDYKVKAEADRVDALLEDKADKDVTYTKDEVDDFLDTKITKSTVQNTFQTVFNDTLTPVFKSGHVVIVDSSYTGTETQGIDLAPYKSIQSATDARTSQGTTYTFEIHSGEYPEDVTIADVTNRSFVGHGISQQLRVNIKSVTISGTAERIALKDLKIKEDLTISASEGNHYFDNIAVSGTLSLTGSGYISIINSDIMGSVAIGPNVIVYMENVTFEDRVAVLNGGTLITKDCYGLTLHGVSGTHMELGNTQFTTSTIQPDFACKYDAGFSLAFLTSGISMTGSGLKPISIANNVPFYIGTLQFDNDNSVLPAETYRVKGGLTSLQVIDSLTRWYGNTDPELKSHLDAIAGKLSDNDALVKTKLKVPVQLEKESDLPAFSSSIKGDYYIIADMDVMSPTQVKQGKAWNDGVETDWVKVLDMVQVEDNITIVKNQANEFEVNFVDLVDGVSITYNPATHTLSAPTGQYTPELLEIVNSDSKVSINLNTPYTVTSQRCTVDYKNARWIFDEKYPVAYVSTDHGEPLVVDTGGFCLANGTTDYLDAEYLIDQYDKEFACIVSNKGNNWIAIIYANGTLINNGTEQAPDYDFSNMISFLNLRTTETYGPTSYNSSAQPGVDEYGRPVVNATDVVRTWTWYDFKSRTLITDGPNSLSHAWLLFDNETANSVANNYGQALYFTIERSGPPENPHNMYCLDNKYTSWREVYWHVFGDEDKLPKGQTQYSQFNNSVYWTQYDKDTGVISDDVPPLAKRQTVGEWHSYQDMLIQPYATKERYGEAIGGIIIGTWNYETFYYATANGFAACLSGVGNYSYSYDITKLDAGTYLLKYNASHVGYILKRDRAIPMNNTFTPYVVNGNTKHTGKLYPAGTAAEIVKAQPVAFNKGTNANIQVHTWKHFGSRGYGFTLGFSTDTTTNLIIFDDARSTLDFCSLIVPVNVRYDIQHAVYTELHNRKCWIIPAFGAFRYYLVIDETLPNECPSVYYIDMTNAFIYSEAAYSYDAGEYFVAPGIHTLLEMGEPGKEILVVGNNSTSTLLNYLYFDYIAEKWVNNADNTTLNRPTYLHKFDNRNLITHTIDGTVARIFNVSSFGYYEEVAYTDLHINWDDTPDPTRISLVQSEFLSTTLNTAQTGPHYNESYLTVQLTEHGLDGDELLAENFADGDEVIIGVEFTYLDAYLVRYDNNTGNFNISVRVVDVDGTKVFRDFEVDLDDNKAYLKSTATPIKNTVVQYPTLYLAGLTPLQDLTTPFAMTAANSHRVIENGKTVELDLFNGVAATAGYTRILADWEGSSLGGSPVFSVASGSTSGVSAIWNRHIVTPTGSLILASSQTLTNNVVLSTGSAGYSGSIDADSRTTRFEYIEKVSDAGGNGFGTWLAFGMNNQTGNGMRIYQLRLAGNGFPEFTPVELPGVPGGERNWTPYYLGKDKTHEYDLYLLMDAVGNNAATVSCAVIRVSLGTGEISLHEYEDGSLVAYSNLAYGNVWRDLAQYPDGTIEIGCQNTVVNKVKQWQYKFTECGSRWTAIRNNYNVDMGSTGRLSLINDGRFITNKADQTSTPTNVKNILFVLPNTGYPATMGFKILKHGGLAIHGGRLETTAANTYSSYMSHWALVIPTTESWGSYVPLPKKEGLFAGVSWENTNYGFAPCRIIETPYTVMFNNRKYYTGNGNALVGYNRPILFDTRVEKDTIDFANVIGNEYRYQSWNSIILSSPFAYKSNSNPLALPNQYKMWVVYTVTNAETLLYDDITAKILPVEGHLFATYGWILSDRWKLYKARPLEWPVVSYASDIPHQQTGEINKIATLNGTVYLSNDGGAPLTYKPEQDTFSTEEEWNEIGVSALMGVDNDLFLFKAPIEDRPLPTTIDKVVMAQLKIRYQGVFYNSVELKDLNLQGTTVMKSFITNGPASINGALTISGWKIEVI